VALLTLPIPARCGPAFLSGGQCTIVWSCVTHGILKVVWVAAPSIAVLQLDIGVRADAPRAVRGSVDYFSAVNHEEERIWLGSTCITRAVQCQR
jgi:hypothetical protein